MENKMKYLTRQEEIYLLAIWKLGADAYGVKIKEVISEMTGKKITYGALYFTLEQLFNKKFVMRTQGDPTPVRGGCSKTYYSLTTVGIEALKETYELQKNIWDDASLALFR